MGKIYFDVEGGSVMDSSVGREDFLENQGLRNGMILRSLAGWAAGPL